MFKLKKKANDNETQKEKVAEEVCCEMVELKQKEDTAEEKQEEKGDNMNNSEAETILKDLENLAILLNTTVDSLKKEFYLTQIKKIMSKLQKTVVRYDMTEAEMDKIFLSASQNSMGGITAAPAYLPNCVKQIKKNKVIIELCSIIDFPFGESSFKAKIANVKESLKLGANTVAVAMPSMMFNTDKLKELKKQCGTLCSASKKRAGIVINASDINQDNYAAAMKIINKSKLSFITLAFGDATLEEVKSKLASLNKCGISKKLYVLANVDRVESVVELFKLKVDKILTPYADDIGNDLLKRFRLI